MNLGADGRANGDAPPRTRPELNETAGGAYLRNNVALEHIEKETVSLDKMAALGRGVSGGRTSDGDSQHFTNGFRSFSESLVLSG